MAQMLLAKTGGCCRLLGVMSNQGGQSWRSFELVEYFGLFV